MITKVYECYCERTKEAQYTNDNFSIMVACKKRPTRAKLEKALKNRLGNYHICYITDDICVDLGVCEIVGVDL